MHRISSALLLAALLALATGCDRERSAHAEEPARTEPAEPPGTTYGAAPALARTTPLDQILADPQRFHGQVVRTRGVIRAVCPHRGCWFDVGAAEESGGRIHVRSLDHAITMPLDSKGKEAELEGEVQALPGVSACGSAEEHEGGEPGCGVAAGGRRAQIALRGVVLR